MKRAFGVLATLLILGHPVCAAQMVETDICVYGGTPAGVMAAVAAARHDYP
jgi:hypothetical protein